MGPMDLLVAAASDEGGITGFLLDLVEKLGPVGVGLSILAETVIPPIPSEAVLGLAGVLINEGRMSVVPVVLFATLGSVLGAIFFYYVGRALGPRRSHAFLDRLPLVETADVDKTFAWFERHGRSAVFFGRMVPIVRSFISVPAGVVRMPFAQFLLVTAAGSLIRNSVLIGLGVAAGDFVRDNLKYLDYAVVAAFALGVGYLVYKRAMDVVPVVLFATLGSLLGAVFFYYVGRALGPRRSHAFLDRLPLVETEDVDKTFAWFERHGRSAVFFGRMVPIVRSFISVPAGVVRMPLGQFLLFTAAGSLIWNSLLIGLGVAAGDFVRDNLHFLDYAVVVAVVLFVAWFLYKKLTGGLRRPPTAGSQMPAEERDQA